MGKTNAAQSPKPQSAKRKPKRRFSGKKLLGWTLVAAAIAVILGLVGYMAIIYKGQTELNANLDKLTMDQASVVLDNGDQEVTKLAIENRQSVTYGEMPPLLGDAFIATEDRRFAKHSGVDFWAIGRAIVKDIVNRKAVEGGSTITQQLAKNMFLNADKTVFRKATEVSIAVALEHRFDKNTILTMYLNRIFFGYNSYGVKAASERYFGVTDLSKLELWQMATLAAIPKGPSVYNPLANPDKSKERRAVVLQLMYEQGYITEAQRSEAAAHVYDPKMAKPLKNSQFLTYIDYVKNEAQDMYGIDEDKLQRGGYKIYTTMDANAQQVLEDAYKNDKLFEKSPDDVKIQSSMTIVNHHDGSVVAIIGGRDYDKGGWNRATSANRQPGSAFKPLASYGPALESGNYTPFSQLKNEKMSFGQYSPRNYNGVYTQSVSMYEAVRKSINIPAVWLLEKNGIDKGMNFAKKLGIPLVPEDRNLAIALGGLTNGASTLQMATAYGAFANNGELYTSHAIRKIVNADGVEVAKFRTDKPTKAMSPKTAWYMTSLLQGVVNEPDGTGRNARMNRPVAGKTGTTQLAVKGLENSPYNNDAWFVGYTPEWTAAVWMGYDKTDANHVVKTGSGVPAKIFSEVMSKALANVPVKPFEKPSGVPDLTAAPKAAGDLSAVYDPALRKVTLKWTPVDDTSAYKLFRKSSKEEQFAELLQVTDASREVSDISVLPDETYEYYVVAYNPDSNLSSEPSNMAQVTTGDAAAPPSPSPSVSPDASGQPGQVSPSPSPEPSPSGKPGKSNKPGGKPGTPGKPDKPGQTPSPPPDAPSPTPTDNPGLLGDLVH